MAELNLRLTASNGIRRIRERILKADLSIYDISQLNQELKSVQAYYDRFVVNHMILVGQAKANEIDAHDQLFDQNEILYNEVCVALNRMILELSPKPKTQGSNSTERNFDLKLDPVSVPSFDGSLHNWLAFKDAFETLVHETDYPEAYKLSKLRMAVDVAKVPLVGSMYTGGYEEVWRALKERFQNPKLLAEVHVSRFINIRSVSEESSKALLSIVDTVQESFRALRVMKVPVDHWDALAIPIVVSKLPANTQREWCMTCSSNEIPKLSALLSFLENRAHSLATELVSVSRPAFSGNRHNQRAHRTVKAHVATTEQSRCNHCQGAHRIGRCSTLLALSPDQRFELLRNSGLCFNCLKSGHSSRQCTAEGCRQCGRKHHTLFCRQPQLQASSLTTPTAGQAATALAYVHGNQRSQQRLARILCDPGSQSSFVTERLANCLNLWREKQRVVVEGIGGYSLARTNSSALLTVRSLYDDFNLTVTVYIIPSITSYTPTKRVDVKQWKHLAGLQLADVHFGIPGGIELLLGADVWGRLIDDGIIKGEHGSPTAQYTKLGWVVFGPTKALKSSTPSVLSFCMQRSDEDVDLTELLTRFWTLEEAAEPKVVDDECNRIFATTHSRTKDGRYIVHIPFRKDMPAIGDSYSSALRQFYALERRLAANDELRRKYVAFMHEYSSLGHMEQVVDSSMPTQCYYIPHHAVTSKFRVVFNASFRTNLGISLNETQLVGPTIQDSLVNIVFRFRRYRIALSADIEKMFRQILVTPEHRNYQRILWRESANEDIKTYRLTTVTYGMACSPYLAVRALHQCAYDNFSMVEDRNQAIYARDTILSSFYVDDFLASCDDVDTAVTLATNVDTILSAGQFKLRKWNSNSSELLAQIPGNDSLNAELVLNCPTASVLGLRWDPIQDELFFKVTLKNIDSVPTKRFVLSEVAQLFDPTGFLAPIVISGKIFIQRLWTAGISWDDVLPHELQESWLDFRNDLSTVNRIRVPRWLGMANGEMTELHGFCDASAKAYAAVIYTKTWGADQISRISLLTARTKVAPTKGATIPRLELCAAHLLAVMMQGVRSSLGLMSSPFTLWSDSRIVLCWLRKDSTTLKPYVANRVRAVQDIAPWRHWNHVRSAENPADCASRGMSASGLLTYRLWWDGPTWLADYRILPNVEREQQLQLEELQAVHLEQKITSLATVLSFTDLTTRTIDGSIISLWDRFSNLLQLQRIVALIFRWRKEWRHNRKSGSIISALELDNALKALIRMDQQREFSSDILQIQNGSDLKQTSRLRSLNPFLDDDGLLRVGGRINRALVSEDHRFPIILPKASTLVWLLINKTHIETLHGGPQLMLQTLRSRYWILHGRQAVKSFVQRAVHIEVVDDLSSHAFLDAFTRFISRRGPCRDLFSDNGTAFVGANRLLKEDIVAWESEQNKQSLSTIGTNWHFITPGAPHQGGLWEAAVKSAKHHLVRLVGGQALWYSQLQTLATRIEACLNSRPITPLYDDPDDKLALTPGDFLIGAPLLAVPEPTVTEIPVNRITHWQWLRQIHQNFWKRWSEEYLSTLQTRSKWQRRSSNIQLGDIVLVRNENLPPTHWRLGRVTEVHPSSDGLIRNVTLKTAGGSCTRAVQYICRLLDADDFEPGGSTGQDVRNSTSPN